MIEENRDRFMDLTEIIRMIDGLRSMGMSDKQIIDFIFWLGTGNEKYKPSKNEKRTNP